MSEMMPEIGGRAPLPIEVEPGKSYWWCACGRSKSQPFCDGSHKGSAFSADRVEGAGGREGVLLHLQALEPQAVVRRQPQEAADVNIES